ncbi:MAG TPA: methyltransferase domain-containing protein [Gammaproteobacteria bacterium]|nr:methyltransferase domain-containing protein [Gammaproteobacteria bacterium]
MANTQGFDSDAYKAGQQRDWNTVAGGWQRWWPVLEVGAKHVTDRMLELADIKPGDRVLDIATGIGEPSLSAARRVGSGGRVVAVDQSGEMLKIAMERAREQGLTNVDFKESDTEKLDLPHYTFNSVLCRWGLMFLPNLVDALGRMQRLLVPGGKLAGAVWSAPERVPSISLAMQVVREALQAPAPPAGTPGPFTLADPELLEDIVIDAGFVEFHCESVPVVFETASAEMYTEFTKDIAAPITAMLAEHPQEVQQEVWAQVTEAARRFETPEGTVRMKNEAICFIAW